MAPAPDSGKGGLNPEFAAAELARQIVLKPVIPVRTEALRAQAQQSAEPGFRATQGQAVASSFGSNRFPRETEAT